MPGTDRTAHPTAAAGLVVGAVIAQTLVMGRAVLLLDVSLVVAFLLWLTTRWRPASKGFFPLYIAGLLCFSLHFVEELATDFYRQFPAFVGYEWTPSLFIAFSATWTVLFILAGLAIHRGVMAGYIVVLFFAIGGGVLNGVGHLLLAAAVGRYFPGLVTAPLMLIIGLALLRRLYSAASSGEAER